MSEFDTSALRELADRAATTGTVAGRTEVVDALVGGRGITSRAGIDGAQRSVRTELRRIANARSTDAEAVPDLINGLVERYATTAASDLPAFSGQSTTPARGGAGRAQSEPLRQALRHSAGTGNPIDDEDLADLRTDLDGPDRIEWEASVISASERVAAARTGGNRGLARSLADQLAAELGGNLVGPPPVPQPTDPRGLAALLDRR